MSFKLRVATTEYGLTSLPAKAVEVSLLCLLKTIEITVLLNTKDLIWNNKNWPVTKQRIFFAAMCLNMRKDLRL